MLKNALYGSNEDIDVYSICESVYYSCDNDEYDYILECVNGWIMRGGVDCDEDILLEDIVLNELNYESLEKFAKAKGWEHNGFSFINNKVSKGRSDEENFYDNFDNMRFNAIEKKLAIRDAKKKGITYTPQLHNATITGKDKSRFSTALGRTEEETDKFKNNYTEISKDSRKGKHQYLQSVISNYGYPITEKDLRQAGFFKHFKVSSLMSPNADERAKAHEFINKVRSDKRKKDEQPSTTQQQTQPPQSTSSQQKSQPSDTTQPPSKQETPPAQPGGGSGNNKQPQTPQQKPQPQTPQQKPQPQTPQQKPQPQTPQQKPQPQTPQQKPQPSKTSSEPLTKGSYIKGGLGVAAAGAAIGGGIYAYQQYKNKPRSVIAKRIQALRGIYKKFMINAQKNPQKAGIFKRIAAKILSVIDKLMAFMQHATG